MSTLILHLPHRWRGPETEIAYTLSTDGLQVSQHGTAQADALPRPGRSTSVMALVPVQHLSWHRITLPSGVGPQSPRLRSVLEGLLEEQLLDEPTQLHLALAPGAQAGKACWVAACDRTWLQTGLQMLESARIAVDRILPQFHPDPEKITHAVIGDAQNSWCVWAAPGTDDGLHLMPLPAAAAWMNAHLSEHKQAVWMAEPAVTAEAARYLPQEPVLRTAAEQALEATRSPWNLAQFQLAQHGQARALRGIAQRWNSFLHAPSWRPARWGAVALLTVQVLGLNAWAWHTQRQFNAQEQAIREVLTQTFPKVSLVIDAPVQMEREVAQLRQQSGALSDSDAEALMAGAALLIPPGATVRQVRYDQGQLRLSGIALDAPMLTAAQSTLQTRKLQVRQDGADLLLMPLP